MAWIAAAGASVLGNLIGANAQKKAAKQADQRLQEGRDYAINQSGLGDYAKTGAAADKLQAGLLGVGGDPQASQDAFNNYLNSSGYQFNLKSGENAITGSAAAKGLLNSGATAKALTKFGQNIGSQYFNDYNNQVGQVAGRGAQASSDLAHTVTGTSNNQAQVAQNSGAATANAYGQIGNTIGNVLGYQYGQSIPGQTGAPAPPATGTSANTIFSNPNIPAVQRPQ